LRVLSTRRRWSPPLSLSGIYISSFFLPSQKSDDT